MEGYKMGWPDSNSENDKKVYEKFKLEKLFYTTPELCVLLGVSMATLDRWVEVYGIRFVRRSKKYNAPRRFHRKQVVELYEIKRLYAEGWAKKGIERQLVDLRRNRNKHKWIETTKICKYPTRVSA